LLRLLVGKLNGVGSLELVSVLTHLPNMGKRQVEPANPKVKTSDVLSGSSHKATAGRNGMQTRRQSESRRRQGSLSPPPQPPPLSVKSQPRRNPSPISDDDNDATAKIVLMGQTYDLQTRVWLDKERVISDFTSYELNGFRYQEFITNSIKRASEFVSCDIATISLVRGQADIQAARLAKGKGASLDVHDENDWKRVENTIRGWMLSSRKDIRVDLDFYLKRKVMTEAQDIKTSESMSSNANLKPSGKKAPAVPTCFVFVTDLTRLPLLRNICLECKIVKGKLDLRTISSKSCNVGAASINHVTTTDLPAW
jgi:hypothetical protein